jgi:ubiquinone biosynthesis accessory factor UbiK
MAFTQSRAAFFNRILPWGAARLPAASVPGVRCCRFNGLREGTRFPCPIEVQRPARLPDLRASEGRKFAEGPEWRLVFATGLGYYSGTMKSDSIDKLARSLAETVPEGIRSVRDDLEQNFRAVLRSGLAKLDLVTREEFEVQEAVLARTRERHDALEKRLAALEAKLGDRKPVSRPSARKKSSKKKT